jgi:hypothetical protein
MPYFDSRPSFAFNLARAPRSRVHARATELVGRYPGLSPQQIDELAAIFPRLKASDIAQMMADDTLAPRLDAFCAVHRRQVFPSLSDYLVIAAIMAFPLMASLAIMVAR